MNFYIVRLAEDKIASFKTTMDVKVGDILDIRGAKYQVLNIEHHLEYDLDKEGYHNNNMLVGRTYLGVKYIY